MKHYNLLKKLSQKSDHHTHKMGCVIERKGRIIGRGFNMLATHRESPHGYKCKHAEFNAFLDSDRNIQGSVVYVFRENKNGILSIARPCPSCYRLLMENGAKVVVYSYEGGYKQEKLK